MLLGNMLSRRLSSLEEHRVVGKCSFKAVLEWRHNALCVFRMQNYISHRSVSAQMFPPILAPLFCLVAITYLYAAKRIN